MDQSLRRYHGYCIKERIGAHYVEQDGATMADVNATIAHAMGLNINETIYSPEGRPFKIANDGQVIKQILA